MAADSDVSSAGSYPIPLSPPYPALSKEVEVRRALSAAARSEKYALFASMNVDLIFEDDWLLVVNKPSGIYCETLLSSLSSFLGTSSSIQSNLHLANRLDRDTSGVMVITKSNDVAAKLVKAFTDRRVKKTYLALCIGRAPTWEKMKITSGHGRSKFGAWRVYSASDVGRLLPGGSIVKSMATTLEILSVNKQGKLRVPNDLTMMDDSNSVVVEGRAVEEGRRDGDDDEVLIRAYPESGRTHQIRLHCQHLGIPIRGDVKYGGVHEWKEMVYDFHALHAERLSFRHPATGFPVVFSAPLPSWVGEACEVQ